MSGEYQYDYPIGLYDLYYSSCSLAEVAILSFGKQEKARANQCIEDLPYNSNSRATPKESNQLSTLVAQGQTMGHALAIAPSVEGGQAGTAGIFYTVNLDREPEVHSAQTFFMPSVKHLAKDKQHDVVIEDLISRFTKSELEALLRMSGKILDTMRLEDKMDAVEEDTYTARNEETLQRRSGLEPNIVHALHDYSLDDLSAIFPSSSATEASGYNGETLHILEWNDFIQIAQSYFRREDDKRRPKATVALQHTDNRYHYVMRLQAEGGALTKIQLLRADLVTDEWKEQEFDLQSVQDEDDWETLQIDPGWDKHELMGAVQQGQPISNEVYKGYLVLAAEDPNTSIPEAVVINYVEEQKKRRSA